MNPGDLVVHSERHFVRGLYQLSSDGRMMLSGITFNPGTIGMVLDTKTWPEPNPYLPSGAGSDYVCLLTQNGVGWACRVWVKDLT